MKKNIINLAGALLSSAMLMFGCSEDLPSYSDLKVDKTEVFIKADGENPTAVVNITEGNGNYNVTVADENVATATLNGDEITISGLNNGATTVTVTDWSKHSAVIKVNVKEDFELTLDQTELVMTKATKPVEVNIIAGNGGYQVESSNIEVATAELTSEGKVRVTAIGNGSATIKVTDADGKMASLNVTVCDQLILEKESEIMAVNGTLKVAITAGSGEYTVTSDNANVATAVVAESGDAIVITAVSKGEAKITVTDKWEFKATIAIKVVDDFKLETTTITLLDIETPQTIKILEGSEDYTISTTSESLKCVISDDKSTLTLSGIEKKMAFNQTVTVKDNKLNKTLEISVKEVNYKPDAFGCARWLIDGNFGIPSNSKFEIKNGREYLTVGTKSGSKYINGYVLSFEGNRLIYGVKDNPTLYRLDSEGKEAEKIKIDYLQVYKTETGTDGNGKYWISFYVDEGNYSLSYIITETK